MANGLCAAESFKYLAWPCMSRFWFQLAAMAAKSKKRVHTSLVQGTLLFYSSVVWSRSVGPGETRGGGSTSVHLVWIKLKSSETEHSYFWPQLFMSYVLLCSVSIARRLTFTLWTISLINKIGVVVYFLWLRIVKLSVWLSLKSLFCFPKIKSVTVALWWEWEELNEGSIVLMRQFSLDQNGGQTRYSASIEPSYSNKNKESITWDLVLIC